MCVCMGASSCASASVCVDLCILCTCHDCVYACVYAYTQLHVCIYINMYICMRTHMYLHMGKHICMYMQTYCATLVMYCVLSIQYDICIMYLYMCTYVYTDMSATCLCKYGCAWKL